MKIKVTYTESITRTTELEIDTLARLDTYEDHYTARRLSAIQLASANRDEHKVVSNNITIKKVQQQQP